MKSLKIFGLLATLAISMLASATDIVTVVNPAPTLYQQSTNSPCIIGESSCQNGGFPMTSLPNGSPSTYNEFSPVYTVSQITSQVGSNSFFVGIDLNQTNVAQTLTFFEVIINGVVVYALPSPVVLATQNNGNGYADFLLAGPGGLAFSLAGLNATDTVQFHMKMNQNDGKEQFFLIAGPNTTQVPEPASLFLMGTGLIGFGRMARKHFKK